jgi:hypothetical protein
MTGQHAIDAASVIAESMKVSNQAARDLCARLNDAAARLESETDRRAPLPELLVACSQDWRNEEQSLTSHLSTVQGQLDAQARSVSDAVGSMRECLANTDACDLRAQAMLTQAASTEERLSRTTEECTQLCAGMIFIQAQLEDICEEIGR